MKAERFRSFRFVELRFCNDSLLRFSFLIIYRTACIDLTFPFNCISRHSPRHFARFRTERDFILAVSPRDGRRALRSSLGTQRILSTDLEMDSLSAALSGLKRRFW